MTNDFLRNVENTIGWAYEIPRRQAYIAEHAKFTKAAKKNPKITEKMTAMANGDKL